MVTQVPQVTLFLLLSQIPSLPSLAFLHRMSDEVLYRQFRLCITTAQMAAAKASGYAHTPRRGRNFFCLQKEYHDGVCTVISRCRKATFHIPLAEYFTLTERISLYE